MPVYSREDIREQYCINDKELQVLDNKKKKGILGCFSDNGNSGMSPCSKHAKRCEMRFSDVPTPDLLINIILQTNKRNIRH